MPAQQGLVPMVAQDGALLYFTFLLVFIVKAFRKSQQSRNVSRTGKWRRSLRLWICAAVSWVKRNAGQDQEEVPQKMKHKGPLQRLKAGNKKPGQEPGYFQNGFQQVACETIEIHLKDTSTWPTKTLSQGMRRAKQSSFYPPFSLHCSGRKEWYL